MTIECPAHLCSERKIGQYTYLTVALRQAAIEGTLDPTHLGLLLPNDFPFSDQETRITKWTPNALRTPIERLVDSVPNVLVFNAAWSIQVNLRLSALPKEVVKEVAIRFIDHNIRIQALSSDYEWYSVMSAHVCLAPGLLALEPQSLVMPSHHEDGLLTLRYKEQQGVLSSAAVVTDQQPPARTRPARRGVTYRRPCRPYNENNFLLPEADCSHLHVCLNCLKPGHKAGEAACGRKRMKIRKH